jgi:hypothetical protein
LHQEKEAQELTQIVKEKKHFGVKFAKKILILSKRGVSIEGDNMLI